MTDWLTLCRLHSFKPCAEPLLRLSANYTGVDSCLPKCRCQWSKLEYRYELKYAVNACVCAKRWYFSALSFCQTNWLKYQM